MKQSKAREVNIVMGDLNAKVGEGRSNKIVGDFGLGMRNDRGQRWVEWCGSWNQVIMNTYFRHHPRYLYTWKSPGDRNRNQIDYITVNHRFRNSVKNVRTYPGADCGGGCDHNAVVVKIKVKFKKRNQVRRGKRRDWGILRQDREVRSRYAVEVKNKYRELSDEADE